MTNIKAREETIVKLSRELERDEIKVSLIEVIIACGILQTILDREGYK